MPFNIKEKIDNLITIKDMPNFYLKDVEVITELLSTQPWFFKGVKEDIISVEALKECFLKNPSLMTRYFNNILYVDNSNHNLVKNSFTYIKQSHIDFIQEVTKDKNVVKELINKNNTPLFAFLKPETIVEFSKEILEVGKSNVYKVESNSYLFCIDKFPMEVWNEENIMLAVKHFKLQGDNIVKNLSQNVKSALNAISSANEDNKEIVYASLSKELQRNKNVCYTFMRENCFNYFKLDSEAQKLESTIVHATFHQQQEVVPINSIALDNIIATKNKQLAITYIKETPSCLLNIKTEVWKNDPEIASVCAKEIDDAQNFLLELKSTTKKILKKF